MLSIYYTSLICLFILNKSYDINLKLYKNNENK